MGNECLHRVSTQANLFPILEPASNALIAVEHIVPIPIDEKDDKENHFTRLEVSKRGRQAFLELCGHFRWRLVVMQEVWKLPFVLESLVEVACGCIERFQRDSFFQDALGKQGDLFGLHEAGEAL